MGFGEDPRPAVTEGGELVAFALLPALLAKGLRASRSRRFFRASMPPFSVATMLVYSFSLAMVMGVRPSDAGAMMSAPARTSAFTISSSPKLHDHVNALQPSLSRALTSAPFSSNASNASTCP